MREKEREEINDMQVKKRDDYTRTMISFWILDYLERERKEMEKGLKYESDLLEFLINRNAMKKPSFSISLFQIPVSNFEFCKLQTISNLWSESVMGARIMSVKNEFET